MRKEKEAGAAHSVRIGHARGWGSSLWADADLHFLPMYEEARGVACLPSIVEAVLRWVRDTEGGIPQGGEWRGREGIHQRTGEPGPERKELRGGMEPQEGE